MEQSNISSYIKHEHTYGSNFEKHVKSHQAISCQHDAVKRLHVPSLASDPGYRPRLGNLGQVTECTSVSSSVKCGC